MDGQHPNSPATGAPFIRILEQPARCALRFRYECEGRSAGSIPGANSTADNKTFPTIQVANYTGQAVVVVSCVTKDPPYRPHPHNLVGKEGCKKGVCTLVINNPDMICSFTSLGIQCVKRKDVEDSLKLRESIKVDPFRTGFSHKNQASNIDLNVVRLCFQVFIEGPEKDKYTVPLPPVVCEAIYDKKAMSDLTITKLSHCSAPATGGKEVILLCDRVTKDDVQICFFEEVKGMVMWEAYGDFQPSDVHKQVAISFRTPKYRDEAITQPVSVQMHLKRPSDGQVSEPRTFMFYPRPEELHGFSRKRPKVDESSLSSYLVTTFAPASVTMMATPLLTEATGTTTAQLPTNPFTEGPIRVPRFSPKLQTETLPLNINQQSTSTQPTSDPAQWTFSPSQLTQAGDVCFAFPDPPPVTIKKEPQEPSGYHVSKPLISSVNNDKAENSMVVDGPLSEKLDSLDLDIDPNDLMNDLNFQNLMVNLDSGNNITFNSSGNITSHLSTLNTPTTDDNRNPLTTFLAQNDLSRLN